MREAPPSAGLCLEGPLPCACLWAPRNSSQPSLHLGGGGPGQKPRPGLMMCMRDPGGQPCPLPHGRWWPPGPPVRPEQQPPPLHPGGPGRPGEGSEPTELRLRLEKHISEQRTGYGGEARLAAREHGRGVATACGQGWKDHQGGQGRAFPAEGTKPARVLRLRPLGRPGRGSCRPRRQGTQLWGVALPGSDIPTSRQSGCRSISSGAPLARGSGCGLRASERK